MAHFNFVTSQNAKCVHAGFYIDCHRMTVLKIFFYKKALVIMFPFQDPDNVPWMVSFSKRSPDFIWMPPVLLYPISELLLLITKLVDNPNCLFRQFTVLICICVLVRVRINCRPVFASCFWKS